MGRPSLLRCLSETGHLSINNHIPMAELRQHRGSTSFFEAAPSLPRELTIDPLEDDDEIIATPTSPKPRQRHGSSIAGLQHIASQAITDGSKHVADSFVFAFDIDGVLVRGGKPIPEAIEAMEVLNGKNEYNIVV